MISTVPVIILQRCMTSYFLMISILTFSISIDIIWYREITLIYTVEEEFLKNVCRVSNNIKNCFEDISYLCKWNLILKKYHWQYIKVKSSFFNHIHAIIISFSIRGKMACLTVYYHLG